jgi:hypothetical protein
MPVQYGAWEAMGIAYQFDTRYGVTFTLWDGTVTAGEWLDHIRSMTADPAWPAGTLWLADTTSVRDVSSIGEAEIERAAEQFCDYREKIQHGKVAIVAHDVFLKARIFERYLSLCGPNVIVFNELGTAARWLGIDPGAAGEVTQRLRLRLQRNEKDG